MSFEKIKAVFESAGIENFEHVPKEIPERKKFAVLFNQFNNYLEAAKVQGFSWKKKEYTFTDEETNEKTVIRVALDETTYLILVKRYKEIQNSGGSGANDDVPYEINGYLTTIDTDKIDSDYMNSRFDKYLKLLHKEGTTAEELQKAEDELHKTFATLSQEEQKFANIFLHDIQSGDVAVTEGKTLRDYITEYLVKAKDDQVHRLASVFGMNEDDLRKMTKQQITKENINEFGRYDALRSTVDLAKSKKYFEAISGKKIPPPIVNISIDKLLREFILSGGFDIEMPK